LFKVFGFYNNLLEIPPTMVANEFTSEYGGLSHKSGRLL
jgi:hypothetical protein